MDKYNNPGRISRFADRHNNKFLCIISGYLVGVLCYVKWKNYKGEPLQPVTPEDLEWMNVDLEEKLLDLMEWKDDVKDELKDKIYKYFDSSKK